MNSFSNSDLVQILKEINQIAQSGKTSSQFKALVDHEATARILLVIITKDYAIRDAPSQEIDSNVLYQIHPYEFMALMK